MSSQSTQSNEANFDNIQKLASLIGQQAELDGKRKESARGFKKRLQKLDAQIAECAAEIRGSGAKQ
ncbi:MAG: hypothetical protein WBV94_31885 [Blastocatellia bacterium]